MPNYRPIITVTILSVGEKLYRNDKNNPLLGGDRFYQMTSNDLSELHRLAIDVLGIDPKKRFNPENFTYWVSEGGKNQALNLGVAQSWHFPADYKTVLQEQAAENPKYVDMAYLYDWYVDAENQRQAKIK